MKSSDLSLKRVNENSLEDEEVEAVNLKSVSSIKTLSNTPLYALPTYHKGM